MTLSTTPHNDPTAGSGLLFSGADAEEARDLFLTGLRNAHAVEKQAEQLIERQLGGLEDYPEVAARMREHLAETRRQTQRLDTILQSLNDDSSTFKDAAMGLMGNLAAMAHMPSDDAILKNTFANLAFENYEIAAYRSLITMAESCGFREACDLLEQSLAEEEAMARWIDEHTPAVTEKYMRLALAAQH
jgi:ferritin-like metal-binding protein YciE